MDDIIGKGVLPTELDTEGIRRKWSAEIRRKAFFSARVEEVRILERLRDLCQRYADGDMNAADARMHALDFLDSIGYSGDGEPGIRDLSSRRRLDLILSTQKRMADSVARLATETPSQVRRYPAWRLERIGSRLAPREDWPLRWHAAGVACGFQGACKDDFVALKNSPIWQALGDGGGVFKDTLGNPYPPFAFNSGMGWTRVSRAEAESLGLDVDSARVPDSPGFGPSKGEVEEAGRLHPGFGLEAL